MRKSSCRRLFFAAVVLAVLSAPLRQVAASAYNDWSGVWSSTYGNITFSWAKGDIAAIYGKNGKMTLKPADPWAKVIRGTWSEGRLSGDVELRMDDDMKGFKGWRNSPGNPWTGNRETVPEPID